MSGATLINPNQERNYFLNKPMSTVNQPSVGQASSAPLNFLASSSGGNFQDSQSRSHQNANSNSRREYGQKNNNNFVSHKNNNNYHANNGSYNNNGNVNTSSNERNSKQSYNNNNNNNNNSYDNSFRSYNNQRDRKQSPYCRDRSSAEEVSEAPSKTKAIQKQYKTLKLSIKFDLTDNVRRQQQLRVNVNCFQNKFSKMNNTIIPTLPKFLLQNQQPQQTPSAMNNRPY